MFLLPAFTNFEVFPFFFLFQADIIPKCCEVPFFSFIHSFFERGHTNLAVYIVVFISLSKLRVGASDQQPIGIIQPNVNKTSDTKRCENIDTLYINKNYYLKSGNILR